MDEESKTLRLGSCKRNADRLVADLSKFDGHIDRFLATTKRFEGWAVQKVAIAPRLDERHRRAAQQRDYLPQDLIDLTRGLHP